MGRVATTVLKAAGVLLLALFVLSAIATIVALTLSIVTTVVSIVVTLVVLAVVVLAAVGLWSLVRDDESDAAAETDRVDRRAADDRDPRERLRERYVAGEIDDAEFERQLDLLLETEDAETQLDDLERSNRDADRTRLWDR